MPGIPISLMPLVTQLNNTDRFVISQGSNAGDNKAIQYQALVSLVQAISGQVLQSGQGTNYLNNNIAPDVITNMAVILTQGKWILDFSSSMSGTGVTGPNLAYYLVYNINPVNSSHIVPLLDHKLPIQYSRQNIRDRTGILLWSNK